MKRALRIMMGSMLVVGLIVSSVGSAFAQEPPTNTANVFGVVIAKDQVNSNEASLELKTNRGNVKVRIVADAQYKNGSFQDMVVGKKVALVADAVNGIFTAKNVLIVPDEPTYKHLVGIITSVSGTTINVVDKEGDTFAFNAQPVIAAPATEVKPGQHVTVVVPKDLTTMKFMAVRIGSAAGEEARASTEITSRVICMNVSPELVKKVCVEMPPELSQRAFINMPPERIKQIWLNLPPELAKEIWLNLPPELVKKIWLSLPPELVKKIWVDIPPELATKEIWLDIERLKQVWLTMPPQLSKQIYLNLPPELAEEVYLNLPPELAKQIWMNLPPELAKEIWIDMPAPKAIEAPLGKVESITVKNRPESNKLKDNKEKGPKK